MSKKFTVAVLEAGRVDDAAAQDISRLVVLLSSVNQGTLDADRLRVVAGNEANSLIVVRSQNDDDSIVGVCVLTVYPTLTNNRSEVTCMAVLPAYANLNVEALLFDECVRIAKARKVNTLQLSTRVTDTDVHVVEQSYGFTPVTHMLTEYELILHEGSLF